METTSSLITVPLKKLSLSGVNVRKSNRDEDIEGLAADILERGLDQNLIVIPGESRGTFEVVAGGRRYLALRRLQADRRIPATFNVPVKLIEPTNARAASLAENIQRVAMNPADEILAFKAIVDDHASEPDPIAYCARRTGRSRDLVEQRLRLAKLPAQILGALRAGTIGLQAASAYAAVDDAELQLLVFRAEEARGIGEKHKPGNIRPALKNRTVPETDPRVAFAGLDAYTAAGGRVDRDIFMGADVGEQLLDPAILDQVVRDKAEEQLARQVARDGYADGLLTQTFTALPIWPKDPKGYRLGGRVSDPETMSSLPSFVVRANAIGVYGLFGSGLHSIGWFEPIAALAAARLEPPRSPMAPEAEPVRTAIDETKTPAGHTVRVGGPPRPGDALRDRALELKAARVAVEHAIEDLADDLFQRVVWPDGGGYLPPLTTAIGDDDMILVAVQIRVPRAELEAAMPEAAAQSESGEATDAQAASEQVAALEVARG